jgi:hypothetical protein
MTTFFDSECKLFHALGNKWCCYYPEALCVDSYLRFAQTKDIWSQSAMEGQNDLPTITRKKLTQGLKIFVRSNLSFPNS